MEFTSLGVYQENLTLQEAVAAYANIDENRIRGIKCIGFRLNDDSIYKDMDYPLVQGGN